MNTRRKSDKDRVEKRYLHAWTLIVFVVDFLYTSSDLITPIDIWSVTGSMSSTPSPSKRARIPATSAIASATASPFTGGAVRASSGPRSVGPSGTSANPAPIVGLGMSPMDSFSPAPGTVDTYAMSGLTPYSATSPAYTVGGTSVMPSAASPISAALAHGTRVLSNIQAASPFLNGAVPMHAQAYVRSPPNMHSGQVIMPQHQHASQPGASRPVPTLPQQGSPEYLRTALQHLQTTLLARLDSQAEAFFDAADSATSVSADSRIIAGKAKAFRAAMDSVLSYLEKNGLASIPLLSLPNAAPGSGETHAVDTAKSDSEQPQNESNSPPVNNPTIESSQPDPPVPSATSQPRVSTSTLHTDIERLQHQAKQLFEQRQRLKESASIVGAILNS